MKDIEVRCLLRNDLRKVTWLDKESQNYVGDYIFTLEPWEEESDAYGLFKKGKLVAYFTFDELLEGAKGFEGLPDMEKDSLYINHVYVKHAHRGKGYGLRLIKEVVEKKTEPIYLIAMTEELISYYEKIGFIHLGDQCMAYEKNGYQSGGASIEKRDSIHRSHSGEEKAIAV